MLKMNKKHIIFPILLSALSLSCFGCDNNTNDNLSNNTSSNNDGKDVVVGDNSQQWVGAPYYRISSNDGESVYEPEIKGNEMPNWSPYFILSKNKTYTLELYTVGMDYKIETDTHNKYDFSFVYDEKVVTINQIILNDEYSEYKSTYEFSSVMNDKEWAQTNLIITFKTNRNDIDNEHYSCEVFYFGTIFLDFR